MRGRKAALTILISLLTCAGLSAQDKLLTLEELYHPENRLNFSGSPPSGLRWLPDGEHYLQRSGGKLLRVNALDGSSRELSTREGLQAAFEKLPGFNADMAKAASRRPAAATSTDGNSLLIEFAHDIFLVEVEKSRVRRLTDAPGREEEADFSPDGRMVSFVRDNDIYVIDLQNGRERRLTHDGSEEIYNGRLDWVYQEEIYGRGRFRAYWWSPDSTRLAYLQLDETKVPAFTVIDHRPIHLRKEITRYPKAGDPNPTVRLGVVWALGRETQWLDLGAYIDQEFLLVRVGWTPSGQVAYQVQNREQTWLHLNFADPSSGRSETVLREESPAWVGVLGQPHWLDDGGFLWFSERTGWRHIYRYSEEGDLKGPVTSGEWEARRLHGVDDQGWVYLSGTERSHIGMDVYRTRLDGSGLTRLTQKSGSHSASFNPQRTLFLNRWSDVETPTQVSLRRNDGSQVRMIDANKVELLDEYRLSKPEFLQVKTRDGFAMEAMILRPPDFDPSRKYPVMIHTYAGPHAPQVRNAWRGSRQLWHQMLAQKGYIVWICDNRSASGKGIKASWPIHRNLGELELRDIEDGIAWLKKQSYVDPSRIGIWGWSYGGYMASYSLTHSKSFKIGIAGAPVTDWRLYDTIYTERYMGRPQNNPEGYERSSVLKAAGNLHGKLLILHGTIDDNVHLQNTIQLIDELQKAGKDFEMMLYPGSRHGVRDRRQVYHMQRLMTRFILENL